MELIKYGRKRSGIAKALGKVVNKWIDSIDDKELRKRVEEDCIVTGGSIASMLLGESVNDYDIYFRNMGTAKAVAKYYVGLSGIDAEVNIVSKDNIRGQSEERVCIYVPSAGVEKIRKKKGAKYYPIFMSENAITLSDNIQLITRFYGEPDQIHENFDFVHARCYWDHSKKRLALPADALECLLSRTLHYTGSLYPVASIFRAKKFIQRGWRISAGQMLKIMWQISEIDLTRRDVMQEQLIGVDLTYMAHLIVEINKTDDKLDSTYVAQVIDEVFNEEFE